MIDKQYDKYILGCDYCGVSHEFDDFNEAVQFKKENNWRSIKIKEFWFEVCPLCEADKDE